MKGVAMVYLIAFLVLLTIVGLLGGLRNDQEKIIRKWKKGGGKKLRI